MRARRLPTLPAKSRSARPAASSVFQSARPSSSCIAKQPASSAASTHGATPGMIAFAVSIHMRSYRLRSTGTSHNCSTRRRGSARFTQNDPRRASTRQISEDTPPASAVAGGTSSASASPCLRRNVRTCSGSRGTGSGSEALNGPAVGRVFVTSAVEQAVMEPVLAPLPEFDPCRNDAVAAPVGGAGRIFPVLCLFFLHGYFQDIPAGNNGALCRGACRQARACRPAREILVRVLCGYLLDRSVDAHLPLQLRPQEHQA